MNQNEFQDGQEQIVIEQISPAIDGGRFAIKRCVNDQVFVEAIAFAEGHDPLVVELQYRFEKESDWQIKTFQALGNDRWHCDFVVNKIGRYHYKIRAWIDHFSAWRQELLSWLKSKEDVAIHLLYGSEMIDQVAKRATDDDRIRLQSYAVILKSADNDAAIAAALDEQLAALYFQYVDKKIHYYKNEFSVTVDRQKARFSTWYELFPRSLGKNAQHGNFQDVIDHLPYVAEMGFDVLYLPPIHPIGKAFRKGKNNALTAQPDDCGSPWGIGSEAGGHMSIHPQLGNLDDFQHLIKSAKILGLELAMDIALQCSPDHPYVLKHPQWFKHRPDGSIQYAQNPPKKYQDIFPLYFQSEDWQALWQEILEILLFWIKQGVRIFRVDNPHTKPFVFWEYIITQIKNQYPEVIFLSEAFTRPNIMNYLAKIGFSQSYTYFTWRNTKEELINYFSELTQSSVREYFRPNLWPNTPDILPKFLQQDNRNAFAIRLILAATLGASYGIYGPAFELAVNVPRELDSEEYNDSEKYQLINWDLEHPLTLQPLIRLINYLRRDHSCLQQDWNLQFHSIDNEYLLAYSKYSVDDALLIIVNLHPELTQSGWVELSLDFWQKIIPEKYLVKDLMTGQDYEWYGQRNYIELNPNHSSAHILQLEL